MAQSSNRGYAVIVVLFLAAAGYVVSTRPPWAAPILDALGAAASQTSANNPGGLEGQIAAAPRSGADAVRIATFNLQVYGEAKASNPFVMQRLAAIVRLFDVVAVQEIRTLDETHLQKLLALVNAEGRQYLYVAGPRLGRTVSKEQYAYLYDATKLECDRSQIYTVEDKSDLLHREPLVAWFRVRGLPPADAFSFTLVNFHLDPDEVDRELPLVDEVLRAVKNDGRNEDDVILLGDFNADQIEFAERASLPGMQWVVRDLPTNTRGSAAYDNIVFIGYDTEEYISGGVFDFVREMNLSLEDALKVSDHLPVWAEFSVVEKRPYRADSAGRFFQPPRR
ncbi:MAG TPA: endonuclease/exonuclease/phosphatase family protein [Pirellulaceae bacterium]|nr:endonuclease/exonuclease/phosphatase family protein [Pirellulaceae bacterium]